MKEIIAQNEQITIWKDGNKWELRAETENWAGDCYWFEGKSREHVIKQARKNINKDPKDQLLLRNPLLKEDITNE